MGASWPMLALDIPGRGSKDPGELRFTTQSFFRGIRALSWFGQKPLSFAIPIGLAIGEFIDGILQEFYLTVRLLLLGYRGGGARS